MAMIEPATATTAPQPPTGMQAPGQSRLMVSAAILVALMVAATLVAVAARPKARTAGHSPGIVLETAIPRQFGDWRELPQSAVQVVNPQTQELLDKLYSQTLSRTYVNGQGYRVMLSLAYGDDQRGGLQAHMPEVCYPAQGFKLLSASEHMVKTPFGDIPGKQLMTSLGARQEPITYWFAMGDRAVKSRWEKRIVEVRLALTGQVPDGLVFRMSSIERDPDAAYRTHEAFARDLLTALTPGERQKISGLSPYRP